MLRLGLILALCALLAGCGGRGVVGAGTSTSSTPPTNTGSATPAPAPAAPSSTPTPVSLTAGQTQGGIDVVVSTPAATENAQDLGTNLPSGLGMASNTGGTIHRGSTMRVLLFGPGMSGDMKVTIAGPQDITVANVQGVHATDNTPGVAFMATAAGNASLGSRTVFLQSANGDVTSFTGGLEVIP